MNIAVCIPWYGAVRAQFAFCLFAMAAETKANVTLFNVQGSFLPSQRNTLVRDALASGADYFLWLDTDQTFPPDTLDRLLSHGKDFVVANYPRRLSKETLPTASLGHDYAHTTTAKAKAAPLEAVESVGFGVALTHRRVFERTAKPWFDTQLVGDGTLHKSEDRHFCRNARQAGFVIFIDHALSLHVGHMADVERKFEA